MIVYLISLLVIGSAIAWSLWKAPSDKELWGEDDGIKWPKFFLQEGRKFFHACQLQSPNRN